MAVYVLSTVRQEVFSHREIVTGHARKTQDGLETIWSVHVSRNFIIEHIAWIVLLTSVADCIPMTLFSACPKNNYRSGVTTCSRCPSHTHTNDTGNDLSGCVCDGGYQGNPGQACTGTPSYIYISHLYVSYWFHYFIMLWRNWLT